MVKDDNVSNTSGRPQQISDGPSEQVLISSNEDFTAIRVETPPPLGSQPNHDIPIPTGNRIPIRNTSRIPSINSPVTSATIRSAISPTASHRLHNSTPQSPLLSPSVSPITSSNNSPIISATPSLAVDELPRYHKRSSTNSISPQLNRTIKSIIDTPMPSSVTLPKSPVSTSSNNSSKTESSRKVIPRSDAYIPSTSSSSNATVIPDPLRLIVSSNNPRTTSTSTPTTSTYATSTPATSTPASSTPASSTASTSTPTTSTHATSTHAANIFPRMPTNSSSSSSLSDASAANIATGTPQTLWPFRNTMTITDWINNNTMLGPSLANLDAAITGTRSNISWGNIDSIPTTGSARTNATNVNPSSRNNGTGQQNGSRNASASTRNGVSVGNSNINSGINNSSGRNSLGGTNNNARNISNTPQNNSRGGSRRASTNTRGNAANSSARSSLGNSSTTRGSRNTNRITDTRNITNSGVNRGNVGGGANNVTGTRMAGVGGGVSRVGGGMAGGVAGGVARANRDIATRDTRISLAMGLYDEPLFNDNDSDDDANKPPMYDQNEVDLWNEQAFAEYLRRVKRLYRIHHINIGDEDIFLKETRQIWNMLSAEQVENYITKARKREDGLRNSDDTINSEVMNQNSDQDDDALSSASNTM